MQQQKITPNLWFNGNAKEAAEYYVSVFPEGKILSIENYPNSKEEGLADFQLDLAGKPLTVQFEILGMRFIGINAGPEFTLSEAVSFQVTAKIKQKLITTGKSFLRFRSQSNAAGVRINLALAGRLCLKTWQNLCDALMPSRSLWR